MYCRRSWERRSSGRLWEGGWTDGVRAMREGLFFICSSEGGGTVADDDAAAAVAVLAYRVLCIKSFCCPRRFCVRTGRGICEDESRRRGGIVLYSVSIVNCQAN